MIINMRLGPRGRLSAKNIDTRFNKVKIWQEFTSYWVSMEKVNIGSEGPDSLTLINII